MHDAMKSILMLTQDLHAISERFANVEHHRIAQLLGKLQLFNKPFLLILSWGQVIVIVKAYLSKRQHFFMPERLCNPIHQ